MTVFATGAVQRDEYDVGFALAQRVKETIVVVERARLVAECVQGA